MDKSDYTKRYGTPFPRPKRPAIYDKSIADAATVVISSKAKAIHCDRITDRDSFGAADREAQSFLIDAFDKAWNSKLCKPVTFYAQVTTRHVLELIQGICVGNRAIDILDLQYKM